MRPDDVQSGDTLIDDRTGERCTVSFPNGRDGDSLIRVEYDDRTTWFAYELFERGFGDNYQFPE